MGIRLEWLLVVSVVLIVGAAAMIKLTNTKAQQKLNQKELEFHKTAFTEVDTTRMLSKSFVQKGTFEGGKLYLEKLRYHARSIKSVTSDNAEYDQESLYLIGNVKAETSDGYRYSTQKAKYYQKSEILKIDSKFTAIHDKTMIHGSRLYYDGVKKEMNATKIDAVIYMSKK